MSNDNYDAAIEAALSKETFDVLAFVKGANLPVHDVTLYTDADAALKLARIFTEEAARQKRTNTDSLSIDDEYDGASEEEINALHERLTSTAIVVNMRGLAPAALRAMENHIKATLPYEEGGDNEEYNLAFNNELVAKSIVSVESADGRVDSTKWTRAKVEKLNEALYISESNKLFNAAAEINYIGAIFDRAVSADFS